MSGKVKNKGSFNQEPHNNSMALEGDMDEQMKYKINKVMEVVKNRSQDDVVLVLQYFDYDIDTTVDAFTGEGAAEILKKWSHSNSIKPSNKNKKKKKNKKKNQSFVPENCSSTGVEADILSNDETTDTPTVEVISGEILVANGDSSSLPLEDCSSHVIVEEVNRDCVSITQEDSNCRVSPPLSQTEHVKTTSSLQRQLVKTNDPTAEVSVPVKSVSSQKSVTDTIITTTERSKTAAAVPRYSTAPSDSTRSSNRNRHRSSSDSRSMASEDCSRPEMPPPLAPASSAAATTAYSQVPGKKNLEKSLKDLSRQTSALTRVDHILEEELVNSSKRIKAAIAEAQKLLDQRNQELEQELEKIKNDARHLLAQRKKLALDLKSRADQATTMGEAELNELRADIKHFVVERKYDEDLGKTIRFMWDKDRITREIQDYGEVFPVKNSYSQRRQSVSSVASSSNMTSSITEPQELSPISQTELDQETTETNQEHTLPDTRPQANTFQSHPRFFYRSQSNFRKNESNNYPGYNRGNYLPRGRSGGGGESRGRGGMGRGMGRAAMNRGGRRDDNYRGGHDNAYHQKPHYPHRVHEADEQSGLGGMGADGGSAPTSHWPNRDQKATRHGSGRSNPRYQGRSQMQHHTARNSYGNEDRVTTASDSHVNGSDDASNNLVNGFVDH